MRQVINCFTMQDEFRVCPACGYEDGFHSMFRQAGESLKWLFICPNCHEIFDIGLTVPSPLAD